MQTRPLSAALLATALLTGGAATTLPRALPEHRATGCEAFGPEFRKVEGSDTCIRISGAVRAEVGITTGGGSRR